MPLIAQNHLTKKILKSVFNIQISKLCRINLGFQIIRNREYENKPYYRIDILQILESKPN